MELAEKANGKLPDGRALISSSSEGLQRGPSELKQEDPSSPALEEEEHGGPFSCEAAEGCGVPVAPAAKLPDPDNAYIWYASYASNMWTARFMCYIEGGQVEFMARSCIGAKDRTPPVDSRWMYFPYKMFFGKSWTPTWGFGGVAFLNPVSHGGPATTLMRLYKITLQQFRDVFAQENGQDPSKFQAIIDCSHVDRLRNGFSPTGESILDFVKGSWYGTIKYLGDEDELPILTFTCCLEDMKKFEDGELPICAPTETYCEAVTKGLMEFGLSADEARAYILSNCN